ncbi:MAG: ACP S-malonyltransferase [Gammaproteobacteria bacterium]|nr:ACP S-malonyltransferase [Gammaproteobacteria bacterium]
MHNKKQAVVICPGRGSYNKQQLGYLLQHHQQRSELITTIDQYRTTQGFTSIAALDQMASYDLTTHTLGHNASALIYGCAAGDYQAIDLEQYDICAISGNSMGWYIALAAAQALAPPAAIELINTMGSLMSKQLIGGQIIYPVVDQQWQAQPQVRQQLLSLINTINQAHQCELYLSIDLGAYFVVGGNEAGLKQFSQQVTPVEHYPLRLFNHGAFHTPLLNPLVNDAQGLLAKDLFCPPKIPLIDGRGHIWQPHATDVAQLYQYTLDHQICQPYYFNQAIDVAIKEFAPDVFIVLGPGNGLSSSIAQRLIELEWQGINNKEAFIKRQKDDPIIIAMGLEHQRSLVVTGTKIY